MPTPLDRLLPETRARVEAWAADPDVVGVVWVGSRSRGHADALSDDDLEVFLAPAAFAAVAPLDSYVILRAPDPPARLIYDAQLTLLATLEAKAGSPRDLDHWPYEQAGVLVDRGGVAAAVAAAAAMPAAFRRARLRHGALDLAGAVGRARKTEGRGFPAARNLLIARGAKALSRLVFGLEHRWVPLDHWLEPELATLADPHGVAPLLRAALADSDWRPLEAALARLDAPLGAEAGWLPGDRLRFFSELMHPSNAAERAIHGLD